MIKRDDYTGYIFICYLCGVDSGEKFPTLRDAFEEKESIGWKSEQIDGDWQDICPDCAER